MHTELKQAIRKALSALMSPGGVVGLAVCGILLILSATSSSRFVATALLKIDFVLTNSVVLTPEQYGTNTFGWAPLLTKEKTVCSDWSVSKALAVAKYPRTSKNPDPVAHRLEAKVVRQGLKLRFIDEDADRATATVRAVAEAYRSGRNELAPAPPRCKGLRITLDDRTSGASFDWELFFQGVLSAVSIGLAAGMRVSAGRQSRTWTFVPRSLFWFFLLLGLGIYVTPNLTVALAGATAFSILIATASLCILMAQAQGPPVPPGLLRNVFTVACALLGITACNQRLTQPRYACTTTRVRLSALPSSGQQELPISYDPAFLAGQAELISSDLVAGRTIELAVKENEAKWRDQSFQQVRPELLEYMRRKLDVTSVQGTSIIAISYRDESAEKTKAIAQKVAEVYQDYWKSMRAPDVATRILVTPLGSETRFESLFGHYGEPWLCIFSHEFFGVLFLVGGAIGLSLLAKTPGRLSLVPVGLITYIMALGLAWCVSLLSAPSYTAVSTVRPAAAFFSEAARTNTTGGFLQRELQIAASDEVLANTAVSLEANQEFLILQARPWPRGIDEQVLWLRKRIQTIPVAGNSLIRFSACAESGQSAALIANAAAASYGALPDHGNSKREVVNRATPLVPRDRRGNTLAMALAGPAPYVIPFAIGAGIACLGYAWKKSRTQDSSGGGRETRAKSAFFSWAGVKK